MSSDHRLGCVTALVTVLGTGCEVPATQLLVVVNTDLAVPVETDEIRIRVWSPDRDEPREDRLVAVSSDPPSLPASFGIAPRDGDPDRRVRAAVEARLGGDLVVSTEAATTFVERRTLRLDLFLARDCRAVTCPEGETCRAGSCTPVDIDSGDLRPYVPGEPLGDPPPDRPPPQSTVLVPVSEGTELRHLALDVAPDGAAVVALSFRGALELDDIVSSTQWRGFVARVDRDGNKEWLKTIEGTGQNHTLAYAVAVADDDTVWLATACTGGTQYLVVPGEAESFGHDCGLPSRIDWQLSSDGTHEAPFTYGFDDPLAATVVLDATSRWLAAAYVDRSAPWPWAFTRIDLQPGPPAECSLPAEVRPAVVALDEAGSLWVAGAFEGESPELGVTAAGGADAVVFSVPFDDGNTCAVVNVDARGVPGEDGALGLALGPETSMMVGVWDGDDAFAQLSTANGPTRLEGPGEERLADVAALPDGTWVAVGLSSPGATMGGASIESLGGTAALVVWLDEYGHHADHVVLGGAADDEAVGVEIDPSTGDVIVLGLTTGPTALDLDGVLADGQRAIFLHRIAAQEG